MSSEQPWMKFYPRDWRGDQALRAVSIAARGFWIECLCIMHEAKPYGHLVLNGEKVEGDTLARMTGVSVDEVSALMAELRKAGVLSVTNKGVVFSRRMTKDYSKAQKGKKAAQKRWAEIPENKQENAPPSRSPNASPITQKPEAREQKEKDISLESEFDGWYAAYPRHVGRGQAEKAYRTARRKADAATLLAGAERFSASCRGKDPTFIPHPSTWLNGERWLDDATPMLALVENPPAAPRDPATFTLDDWIVRIRMAQDDPSKWLATWGEPPPPRGIAPEILAPRYLDLHRRKVPA